MRFYFWLTVANVYMAALMAEQHQTLPLILSASGAFMVAVGTHIEDSKLRHDR